MVAYRKSDGIPSVPKAEKWCGWHALAVAQTPVPCGAGRNREMRHLQNLLSTAFWPPLSRLRSGLFF